MESGSSIDAASGLPALNLSSQSARRSEEQTEISHRPKSASAIPDAPDHPAESHIAVELSQQAERTEQTEARDGIRLSLDDKALINRICREAGQSIMKAGDELGLEFEGGTRGGFWGGTFACFGIGAGGGADPGKVKSVIERVLTHPNVVVTPDPIDPRYQQYSVGIDGRTAKLTLQFGDDGKFEHCYAFPSALANRRALRMNLNELKEQGWTTNYGNRTVFDPAAKSVTIDPRDPEKAMASLSKSLSAFVNPEGHEAMMEMVNETHRYMLDYLDRHHSDRPAGAPASYAENFRNLYAKNAGQYEQGDGFYNAFTRYLKSALPAGGVKLESTNGLTMDDVMAILLYRATFLPLNLILRGTDQEAKDIVKPFYEMIDHALEKCERFDGTVMRTIGGQVGPIPAKDIRKYRVGDIITEPAYLSCTTKTEGGFRGNVHFVIELYDEADLGVLSHHSEILGRRGLCFKVLDVKHARGSTPESKYPRVTISLRKVEQADATSSQTLH